MNLRIFIKQRDRNGVGVKDNMDANQKSVPLQSKIDQLETKTVKRVKILSPHKKLRDFI